MFRGLHSTHCTVINVISAPSGALDDGDEPACLVLARSVDIISSFVCAMLFASSGCDDRKTLGCSRGFLTIHEGSQLRRWNSAPPQPLQLT